MVLLNSELSAFRCFKGDGGASRLPFQWAALDSLLSVGARSWAEQSSYGAVGSRGRTSPGLSVLNAFRPESEEPGEVPYAALSKDADSRKRSREQRAGQASPGWAAVRVSPVGLSCPLSSTGDVCCTQSAPQACAQIPACTQPVRRGGGQLSLKDPLISKSKGSLEGFRQKLR